MRRVMQVFILLGLPWVALWIHAQEDIEGAGDHPLVERVAGSHIVTFQRDEYARLNVPVGPLTDGDYQATAALEGEHLQFTYRFEDTDTSTLRIKRSYQQALERAGFEILYADSGAALGSRDGRRFLAHGDLFSRPGRQCCPPPASGDPGIGYLAARSADGSVLLSMATLDDRFGEGPVVLLDVVTAEEMETAMEHEPLTAGEMKEGLVADGKVAVQDILFDFDSDTILPDSADALATIAELMADRPDLHLLVVGHTDNVGDFDYNLRLSLDRAAAVVDYLVDEHQVAAERMQPAGAGMMAPITTNQTESGRTLNRRVELVEMEN